MNFPVASPDFNNINGKPTVSFNGKIYALTEKLGKGAFGTVYCGIQVETGDRYAVKIIDKRKLKDPQVASREIQNMRTMDHPNIIKLLGAVETWGEGVGEFVYLFMEYAWNGDLHNYIKQKEYIIEDKAKLIFYQIISGVQYLHSKKFAHRDLKPQNILIKDRCVKIADFGFSKESGHDNNLFSFCGSPKYIAPEITVDKAGYNGFKADMYSVGIILQDIATAYGKQEMSINCKELFENLTSTNPSFRSSSDDVLKNKWLDPTARK